MTEQKKQMIGHMVRQIMEAQNYRLVSNSIKIRFGDLFNGPQNIHEINNILNQIFTA
jgi:hypothetical protein